MRRSWLVAIVAAGVVAAGPGAGAGVDSARSRHLDGSEAAEPAQTARSRHLDSTPNRQPPQLRREGRWLVDPEGRVVIVHGLNLVYKRKPYVPPNSVTGFRAEDARWLARHGFNGARIGTLWAGLTPDAPGRADPTYLKRWQRVMDLLAEHRIWMQLDAHQDQWHETYGGEGAPDWAMIRPAPYNLLPAVTAPFPLGYWTPETSTVFDQFWANKHGLLDGWVGAWRVAAKEWKRQPYLMGYDLINEPWMGTEWLGCLTGGCAASYRKELQPALEKATRAIRSIDSKNIVWWEPQQFSGGQKLDTFFTSMPGERQLGLSWHNYCFAVFLESQGIPGTSVDTCWDFSEDRAEHALDQSQRMHAVPMMSEWGATDNVKAIHIDAEVADRHLMGWTHWAYKFWNDPTTADNAQGLFRDDRDFATAKQDKLRELVRTYAQATAGTPLSMRFDTTDGDFTFRYRPDPRITAPTRIFVSPLHYPHGYVVKVDRGRIVKRTKSLLLVEAKSTRVVQIRVMPRER